jgi:hypothetical protein
MSVWIGGVDPAAMITATVAALGVEHLTDA